MDKPDYCPGCANENIRPTQADFTFNGKKWYYGFECDDCHQEFWVGSSI